MTPLPCHRLFARGAAVAAAAALPALLPAPAPAAGTRTMTVASFEEFDAGEAEGTVIESTGRVRPGHAARRVPLPDDVDSVWSAAEAPDGTVYLGTGNDGQVLALRGDRVEEVAALDAALVASLAWGDGVLYAGTVPGGAVFAIAPGSPPREVARLGAEHVWALAWDGERKVLWAATGAPGALHAIDPAGSSRLVWDSGDKHLLAMALAPDGAIYAGSADEAIVYRVEDSGRAFALHDFSGDEVRALAVDGAGALFAAVNEFEDKARARRAAPRGKDKPDGTKIDAPADDKPPPPPPGAGRSKGKGAVYRVDAAGHAEQLHALADHTFTSLAAAGPGEVWAGSTADGKVYLVRADRSAATVLDLSENEALLVHLGASPVVGTADAGAVYRVDRAPPPRPTWRSKALDARFSSTWGNLLWHASGPVTIETRSGNTAKPDALWSDWTAPGGGVSAGAERYGAVRSPAARYLQVRAVWPDGASGELSMVKGFSRPANQRARVTAVTAGEQDPKARKGKKDAPDDAPAARRPRPDDKPRAPMVKLQWEVDNPDEDEVVYRLSLREVGQGAWRRLGPPEPLDKPEFEWNTESVADGSYRVKVEASDERANPDPFAVRDSRESDPILVDNGKPRVEGLAVRGRGAAGRATDEHSPVVLVEYSIDGGDWLPASPADGVLDSRSEPFRLVLPDALPPGLHVLAVRAIDLGGNVGVSQHSFRR